jgi:hypothetical protein
MTELGDRGAAAGWMADPYGRHEERFYDGAKWTPYVRDGEANSMDEPIGAMGAGPVPVSALLSAELLLVERGQSRRVERAVRRADGTRVGAVRPVAGRSSLAAMVKKQQFKADALELVDEADRTVVTLLRPLSDAKGMLVLRDAAEAEIGRVVRHERDGATAYDLLSSTSLRLGELRRDGERAVVVDAQGAEVVVMEPDGPAYAVRLVASLADPLRLVAVAACATYDSAWG